MIVSQTAQLDRLKLQGGVGDSFGKAQTLTPPRRVWEMWSSENFVIAGRKRC
jgi:hypothetical protein